jgi:uncharacterized Tic20 family protein
VNFNISYTLYALILSVFAGGLLMGNLFRNFNRLNDFNSMSFNLNLPNIFSFLSISSMVGIVYLVGIALVIIASLKAKDGENYSYPFSIKFIK